MTKTATKFIKGQVGQNETTQATRQVIKMEKPKMSKRETRRRKKLMRLFEMILYEDTVRTMVGVEGEEKAKEELCRMWRQPKRKSKLVTK